MKKTVFVAFAVLLILIGIAAAYMVGRGYGVVGQNNGFNGMGMMNGAGIMGAGMMQNMYLHHEAMEELMENGKYSDLAALRNKLGFNMMPFVDNEEKFKAMQTMHESMEGMHEKMGNSSNGFNGMGMMGNFSGNTGFKGCHG